MRTTIGRAIGAVALGAALVLTASPALAHEERESTFPDGTGSEPQYRPFDAGSPYLVVCKRESRRAVNAMRDRAQRSFNQRLLRECGFDHIQAAVDAVTERGTNIYVLPGVYREEPSWDENAPCTDGYDDEVVDYELIVSCGEVINLVTVAGDSTPDTREVDCNALCDLQIEGTGTRMEDVVLRGGFKPDGDWIKHNGMKADRADGFAVRNMTFELFRENALYVHETDGYLIDRVNARHNDLYGILTFTSDHGVIRDCDTSYNGDSGIYPGSAADVNADNPDTGPLDRWAVEVFGCRSHHNALGFSGSAGNSVWFHDNEVFENQAGYVTDSFVGGHPGMPQDHAWLTGNRIYANNNNYVKEFVHSGRCGGMPADRGYGQGTVCPAFPVPVGTGVMIAGGNRNFIDQNEIYDNWRTGTKLFWVPGVVRGDVLPDEQYDTSNGNHFTGNAFGLHPGGWNQPNGRDVEWDEQGVGNCWQDNRTPTGQVTSDTLLPLPDCDSGGSVSPVGNAAKTAQMAGCAEYNREDNPDPPGCDWFDSPSEPEGRQTGPGEDAGPSGDETATGGGNQTQSGSGDAVAGSSSGGSSPAGGGAPVATVTSARALADTGSAPVPALAGLLVAGVLLQLRRRAHSAP